jgi:hypothetical protein
MHVSYVRYVRETSEGYGSGILADERSPKYGVYQAARFVIFSVVC